MREHDIAALGTVLGAWAHPDDEAYLPGGLMALARDAGSRMVCVTATRGEHGTGDPALRPPDRLAARRTADYSAWVAGEAFVKAVPAGHPPCDRCRWDPTEARWHCAGPVEAIMVGR
ncbi:PIG-L family deacetylase [Actinoplanes sp. NPDC023801]|uniref:PIG-L family deacetylase n=1 Tax=Actinoplanes sp. NPDC023801 TaxID=3154595 RepID=UPI0033C3F57F